MALSIATLLTLTEIADRLRSRRLGSRWMIHSGTAPKSALIGGRRMFRESDIEDYINQAFADAA